jgi:competence protein ComEC
LNTGIHHGELTSDIVKLQQNKYSHYEAAVRSIPEKRPGSLRVEVLVKRIYVQGQWLSVHVRAFLSIPPGTALLPAVSDLLVVKGNLEQPGLPMNPEEFNYRRYLWNKGIVWTGYLPQGSYTVIQTRIPEQNVKAWSFRVSAWADRQFRAHLKNDKSYGLVKAMLLGRRDDLRADQVDDYTTSGTVHILSVSGMHVAVIFFILSYLLGWLKKLKGGKYLYLLANTALLCFYALVTGLPPSVQRAALMCIVLVTAEVFSRKRNAMNTLAFSAFLILLIDPQALFDVGFQLSYAAMTGIFLLYKPLCSLYTPSYRLTKYIWEITALSLAAQLATFPLSLYYFHQFPVYFWLVNPFVITFTNALLPAALLLLILCLAPLPSLQWAVGWFVDLLCRLTNVSVSIPGKLPGFLIENLYLDRPEVCMLYLVLFLFWYAWESGEYRWVKSGCCAAVIFVIYSSSMSIQTYLTPVGMIHAVPKHGVLSFKEGNILYISSDEGFETDIQAYNFHLKNYAIREGITSTVFLSRTGRFHSGALSVMPLKTGVLLTWKGTTIYKGAYFPTRTRLGYDFITGSWTHRMKTIMADQNTRFLLSGEVKKRTQERWFSLIAREKYPAHNLLTEGSVLLP